MTDDMVMRLRAAIEAKEAKAWAVIDRDGKATDERGQWRAYLEGGDDGYAIEDAAGEGGAIIGDQAWAEHIADNDPAATLVTCTAHLKLIGLHATVGPVDDTERPAVCMECGNEWPCDTLRTLAEGYVIEAS